MNDELRHIGVQGMRWGHRSAQTPLQKLKSTAKPWSTGKKVGVGLGIAAGLVLPPLSLSIPFAVGAGIVLGNKARNQAAAQKKLNKLAGKKVYDLKKNNYDETGKIAVKSALIAVGAISSVQIARMFAAHA